ncbi:MAG: protein phosphatase CheZ [Tepidamorphaceae bacterium]|nr:protein phosphatase CheZ [Rhodobiaceae bacterium]MCC0049036.1 protein phosphatase CheZ [Rhodobiaceae bacterium]
MALAAKRFRIERTNEAEVPEDVSAERRHRELVGLIENVRKAVTGTAEQVTEVIGTDLRNQIEEARKIKVELDEIQDAIASTKKELATLHTGSFQGDGMNRVTDELDAIVNGTEQATETILAAAETIDSHAGDLRAMLKRGANVELVSDIQDQTIQIFEACNFQDLTGQRITKVVKTLHFIEDRVNRMMGIWGGLEAFNEIAPHVQEVEDEQQALLNGPALPDDDTRVNQDDIDALFD